MAEVRKLRQMELLRSVASPFTPDWLSTQVWALPPAAKVIRRTSIRISARPKDSSPLDWLHTDALQKKAEKNCWKHLLESNYYDILIILTLRQSETALSSPCCTPVESEQWMWLFVRLLVCHASPLEIPPAAQGSEMSSAQQGCYLVRNAHYLMQEKSFLMENA